MGTAISQKQQLCILVAFLQLGWVSRYANQKIRQLLIANTNTAHYPFRRRFLSVEIFCRTRFNDTHMLYDLLFENIFFKNDV